MTAERTKYQKFEARDIHRSQIKNAPYNPRVINQKALKALKKNIKTKGLLSTLVWNEATGNLVSGHQRLKVMDILEKGDDYTLTVAVVNLSEKEEMEQNIFFNSTTVQGEFDFELLLDILPKIDAYEAGFDDADLNIIGYELAVEEVKTDTQREAEEDIEEFYNQNNTDEEENEEVSYEERKKAVKEAKAATLAGADERMDEGERYVSILFDSYDQKAAWMRKLGFVEEDLFIQFNLLKNKIKVT